MGSIQTTIVLLFCKYLSAGDFNLFYYKVTMCVFLSLAVTAGCSRGPGRLPPPTINASTAGGEAITTYDINNDGKIGGNELDKCPALKAAIARFDKDGDKTINAGEITERIEAWQDSKVGRISLNCIVLHNGRPLPGVEIHFEPEKFLGENLKVAKGMTDQNGSAVISIETTDRNEPPGIAPGLYCIKITKAGENIPAKYNAATNLGQEIAPDVTEIWQGLVFNLRY